MQTCHIILQRTIHSKRRRIVITKAIYVGNSSKSLQGPIFVVHANELSFLSISIVGYVLTTPCLSRLYGVYRENLKDLGLFILLRVRCNMPGNPTMLPERVAILLSADHSSGIVCLWRQL